MYKKKFFLLFFILFFSCPWFNKEENQKIFYKVIFQLDVEKGRICIFKVSHIAEAKCSSELPFSKNFCRTFEFFNQKKKLPKEKVVHAEFIKLLSELELDYSKIKNGLKSIFVLSFEKEYFKREKEFLKEFEPTLKKYSLKLEVFFLKEEEETKYYSEILETNSFLFHYLRENESRFLIKKPQLAKDLFFREELSPYIIGKKNEHRKEFISCRQALSTKIRSTGKTGIENASICQEIILEELKSNKIYLSLQKEIRERHISNFYLQGEDWNNIQEILGSPNILYHELLEKQSDYCYLSPMELIKKYKLSKNSARNACYTLAYAISFLDFLNIKQAKIISQDDFLRYVSIHPQFDTECNPDLSPVKKKS